MPETFFDPLKFDHLSVAQDFDEYVRRAARDLADPDAKGDATITVKIKISRAAEGSILAAPSCSYSPPKYKRDSLIAQTTPSGEVVTQTGRQERLGLDNVTTLKTGAAR